eukprot:222168-Hanusia_phi.AAC.1
MDSSQVDPPRKLPAPCLLHVVPVLHRRCDRPPRLRAVVPVEGEGRNPVPPPVVRAEQTGQQLADGGKGQVPGDIPHPQAAVHCLRAGRRVGKPALHSRSSQDLPVIPLVKRSIRVSESVGEACSSTLYRVPVSERLGNELQLARVQHHERLRRRHLACARCPQLIHKPPPPCRQQFLSPAPTPRHIISTSHSRRRRANSPSEVASEVLQVEVAEQSVGGLGELQERLLEGSDRIIPTVELHQGPAMVDPCLLPHLPRRVLLRPCPSSTASPHSHEGIDSLRPALEGAVRLSEHEMG